MVEPKAHGGGILQAPPFPLSNNQGCEGPPAEEEETQELTMAVKEGLREVDDHFDQVLRAIDSVSDAIVETLEGFKINVQAQMKT